jgi:hypothetical protein
MKTLTDLEKYWLCCNQVISPAQKMQIEGLARQFADDTPNIVACMGGDLFVPRAPSKKDYDRATKALGFFTESEKDYFFAALQNSGVFCKQLV